MSASPGITRIGQVALSVHDLARATAFYRDTLGLTFLFTAPPGMSFFDCAGTRLLLGGPETGTPAHHTSVLYYFVPDIQAAVKLLRERGVVFGHDPSMIARMADQEVWLAEFKDSEGNDAALMSEVRV